MIDNHRNSTPYTRKKDKSTIQASKQSLKILIKKNSTEIEKWTQIFKLDKRKKLKWEEGKDQM